MNWINCFKARTDPKKGATSLNVIRENQGIRVLPTSSGPQCVVARLGGSGEIIAVGKINVFGLSGAGYNGGGRVISVLPDGRNLTDMSYSINGDIPTNLRVKITVWAGNSLFENGTNTMWLSAADFDEFGVANAQVFTSGAICQSVELYLAD